MGSGPFDYLQGFTLEGDRARRKPSPWMPTRPFTGIHSPSVHLPADGTEAGISQDALALVKGRGYTGRIVLASDPGVAVTVRIAGETGASAELASITPDLEFRTYPFRFVSPWSSDGGRIEIVGTGTGSFRIGAVSLMPSRTTSTDGGARSSPS